MVTAASLLGVTALLIATLVIALRSQARTRRGLLTRWGIPRAPRRGFASWGEVRSRLDGRIAGKVRVIVAPKATHTAGANDDLSRA